MSRREDRNVAPTAIHVLTTDELKQIAAIKFDEAASATGPEQQDILVSAHRYCKRRRRPHDNDKERTETAENIDEQALLALVVTKQEQIVGRRGALL
jgi:hypothetical protein